MDNRFFGHRGIPEMILGSARRPRRFSMQNGSRYPLKAGQNPNGNCEKPGRNRPEIERKSRKISYTFKLSFDFDDFPRFPVGFWQVAAEAPALTVQRLRAPRAHSRGGEPPNLHQTPSRGLCARDYTKRNPSKLQSIDCNTKRTTAGSMSYAIQTP